MKPNVGQRWRFVRVENDDIKYDYIAEVTSLHPFYMKVLEIKYQEKRATEPRTLGETLIINYGCAIDLNGPVKNTNGRQWIYLEGQDKPQ